MRLTLLRARLLQGDGAPQIFRASARDGALLPDEDMHRHRSRRFGLTATAEQYFSQQQASQLTHQSHQSSRASRRVDMT